MAVSAPVRAALALTLLFACPAYPQAKGPAKVPDKPPAAKAKLTPDQRRGLGLLKASEAEAAGLQPEMRAFVLWQVSRGYSQLQPEKSKAVLREALKVTEAVEDSSPEGCVWEVCHIKWYLQRHLMGELIQRSQAAGNYDEIEQMLPHLDARVRNETVSRLIMEYAEKEKFSRARALLDQFDNDAEYADSAYWNAAEQLLVYDSYPADRLAIFEQAVAHFRGQSGGDPQSSDLASMVMRFSHDLPAGTVLDAIDQILAQAKEQDESRKTRIGVNAGGNSVYFDSRYQFRLFQLAPVLEDLDKPKAESLLRDNAEVRNAFDKFPKGPQSMDPKSYGDQPLPEGEYGTAEVDVIESQDPAGAASEQALDQHMAQIEATLDKVAREADKDPRQAYQDAQELPLRDDYSKGSWRAMAMQLIANLAVKKDPDIARKAMGDLQKLAAELDLATQARMLTAVPNFYIEVGDMEQARASVKDLMKLAEKLYARDVDSSDPNLLFKGVWPSTALWRRCVQFGARISPEFAEEVIAQVPDVEIQTFERVNYGATLAGSEPFRASIMEWHKGGRRAGAMF
jgi:hypothetical protein